MGEAERERRKLGLRQVWQGEERPNLVIMLVDIRIMPFGRFFFLSFFSFLLK